MDVLTFDLDPDAKDCPFWTHFLHPFTAGSDVGYTFIQAWIKCLLHAQITAEVFLFIVGQALKGKSVPTFAFASWAKKIT